jgi:hypothetical protein
LVVWEATLLLFEHYGAKLQTIGSLGGFFIFFPIFSIINYNLYLYRYYCDFVMCIYIFMMQLITHSTILDALVLVLLPFLFLSPASSLYGGLFHLFLGLFVPLFGSSGFRRFTALRLRQVFYAPPQRHSLIATFLSGVPAKSRLSLLRLIILLFILCFIWFPYIWFSLFIFCFAGFPCIYFSISLYCFFLFV